MQEYSRARRLALLAPCAREREREEERWSARAVLAIGDTFPRKESIKWSPLNREQLPVTIYTIDVDAETHAS